MPETQGPLVIVGGHEDHDGERKILREIARLLDGRTLLLCPDASKVPEGYVDRYRSAFGSLGVDVVPVHSATDDPELLGSAGGIFFSGGDQDRLLAAVAGTPLARAVDDLRCRGGVVAGTSAGASVMGDTVLARGPGDASPATDDVELASGLGLLPGVLIDQHFAQRGRIGRLTASIVRRPELLGVGIDEDTAIIVEGSVFRVIGSGAVYVIDAGHASITDTPQAERPMAASGLELHVLPHASEFDLRERRATLP
jgi:cyanophycinase